MPKSHQDYAEWTPERLVHWAEKTGPETVLVVEAILRGRPIRSRAFAPASD